jgi:rare lipoprotein A
LVRQWVGYIVSSRRWPATSCFGIEAASNRDVARSPSLWKPAQLFALALAISALAGCAQAPVNTSKSALSATNRYSSLLRTKSTNQFALAPKAQVPREASVGLASFYTEGLRTANGEKLDPGELTAAHRTLPFGTRLRVTRLDTGRSVIVRVNDRGPFVRGRSVDVSYSAAEKLGIIQQGVAKVKVEVVQ